MRRWKRANRVYSFSGDWLVFNPLGDGVCSNPSCVEKAYLEARPLAESIDEALRMEEAA